MMTARQLVRRLLVLRRSSPPVGNLMLQEGEHFGRNAQSAVYANFGLAPQVENKMTEAQGEHAIAQQASFDNHLAVLDGQVGGFTYGHGVALDHDGFGSQSGVFGQQSSLPSQSLNTVSGFWVPFKRRAA